MQPNDRTLCWDLYELNRRCIETQAVFMTVVVTVRNESPDRCHQVAFRAPTCRVAAPDPFFELKNGRFIVENPS